MKMIISGLRLRANIVILSPLAAAFRPRNPFSVSALFFSSRASTDDDNDERELWLWDRLLT